MTKSTLLTALQAIRALLGDTTKTALAVRMPALEIVERVLGTDDGRKRT